MFQCKNYFCSYTVTFSHLRQCVPKLRHVVFQVYIYVYTALVQNSGGGTTLADLVNSEQFAKIYVPTKIFIIKLLVDYWLIEKNTQQQMNIKQVHL